MPSLLCLFPRPPINAMRQRGRFRLRSKTIQLLSAACLHLIVVVVLVR
jgi:hypothetical protein